MTERRELLIGTYPSAGQGTAAGRGEGIWGVHLDLSTGRLRDARQLATTPAPSFLCTGPRADVVYAVNETETGSVTAWRRSGDELIAAGATSTGGSDPCHVRYLPSIRSLIVTNYTSGSVAIIPVDDDGGLTATRPTQLFPLSGHGPDATRQGGPHAHQSLISPDGRHVIVTDLGSDTLWRFAIDAEARGLAFDGPAAVLPGGTGPRHGVFSADGTSLYLAGELDGNVHEFRWDPSTGTARASSVAPVEWPGGGALAHIERVGDRLLVGCRGSDLIARLDIHQGGLRRETLQKLPGACPRHHLSLDGWLVVALQESDRVVVLDAGGRVHGSAEIPSPSCVQISPAGSSSRLILH